MKIVISKLPKSGWWQNGIPKYDDNPAMVEGAIPDLNIVEKERQGLISLIRNSGHEVIEFDFPNELDQDDKTCATSKTAVDACTLRPPMPIPVPKRL